MRFLIIIVAYSLISCTKGYKSDITAFDSLSLMNSDTSRDSIKNLRTTEYLIVSLFRKFEKISDNDSVTNFLIKNGRVTKKTEDGDYTFIMDIDSIKNALRIEDTESGNSSFIVKEYRVVKVDSLIKFIHSKFVGTNAFVSQDKIEVYDYYNATHTFKLDSISSNTLKYNVQDFFLQETPDSIISDYMNHSSNFFHIVYNESGVAEYTLRDHYTLDDQKNNKWIIGNTIKFEFTGKKLLRSKPYYSE